jgi:hypothetical protein
MHSNHTNKMKEYRICIFSTTWAQVGGTQEERKGIENKRTITSSQYVSNAKLMCDAHVTNHCAESKHRL